MGFDYASLLGPPTKVPMIADDGSKLNMELNLSLVTADFLSTLENTTNALAAARAPRAARRAAKAKQRHLAAQPEPESVVRARVNEMRFMASVLGGPEGDDDPTARVVVAWDMTRNKKPVQPSFEFFYGLPYAVLAKLFAFCCFEAAAPKKTEEK